MLCGGLALAAFPGTSGFFSKDEILAYADARGGMYVIFAVLGYLGALLTAVYSFRLVFRILPGRPCKEAQELIETGHVAHGEPATRRPASPRTPRSASPGPSTTSPSSRVDEGRRWRCSPSSPWSAAWSRSRGSTTWSASFLEPVFDDSPLPRSTLGRRRMGRPRRSAAAISLAGIGIAYWLYVPGPRRPAMLIRRLRPLHTLFVNKWYFDEAIDLLVVRPALAIGRFANRTFERLVVDGLVSGTRETVGGAGGIVRAVQSGFVRSYALLLIAGFAGLALYFLIVVSS